MPAGFGPRRPGAAGAGQARPPASRVFAAKDGDVAIFWPSEEPARRAIPGLSTERRALDFLKALREPARAASTLRDFYRAHWTKVLEATSAADRTTLFGLVFGEPQLDAAACEAVLAAAARHIAAGRLRLCRVEQVRGGPSVAPEAEQAAPAMEKASRTKLTWVAIQLLDHEDNPVPGEAYELTLPDGAVRSGTLDGDGRAEERGIESGTCTVRFPNLSDDAWEFVESRES